MFYPLITLLSVSWLATCEFLCPWRQVWKHRLLLAELRSTCPLLFFILAHSPTKISVVLPISTVPAVKSTVILSQTGQHHCITLYITRLPISSYPLQHSGDSLNKQKWAKEANEHLGNGHYPVWKYYHFVNEIGGIFLLCKCLAHKLTSADTTKNKWITHLRY